MSCYFYFVFLPRRPELWGLDPFVLCVSCLTVFSETISHIFGCSIYLVLNVKEMLNVGCCKSPPSSSYFV